MRIIDSEIGTYVGLNDDGGVTEYFADAEAAWNTEAHDEATVSVGYVTAIPTDYDELFNTEFDCTACGRTEITCSQDPCAEVQKDRQS